MKYKGRSLSDPNGENGGIVFIQLNDAHKHCSTMNKLIAEYDNEDSIWNKSFWKTKPEPWRVFKADDDGKETQEQNESI